VVAAVAIPVAAHLPKWVEFEIVAVVWWLVWTLVLAYLLFNAHEVEDDFEKPSKADFKSRKVDKDGCFWICILADLGMNIGSCFGVVGIIVVGVIGLLVGVYFVYDVVLIAIAFLLYLAIRGMLARAINPTRSCEGNAPLALFWGMIWATAYTAPIALIIWGIKALILRSSA